MSAALIRLLLACAATVAPLGAQPRNLAFLDGDCDTASTPFCDAMMAPLPGWSGHVFHLSQDYPTAIAPDAQPWLRFDPKTQPQLYLAAVLSYFFEGNIHADVEASFDPALNTKRGWYNAPWQDPGIKTGREFIHGLTKERISRPFELAPQQSHLWNNYAVGYYNAPGGMILGRVWKDHAAPNAVAASFPNGTVTAKMVFTTAPVAEVPYLKRAPVWHAYVFADRSEWEPTANSPRAVLALRLLQIDLAVKDDRVADTTGWVFGTYVYGGGPGGPPNRRGWHNVAAVGALWGNDPGYSGNGRLTQTWINPAVHMPHLGYQGRLSGPIDYPVSSCLSCHSTGETPAGTLLPPDGADPSPWFRNLQSGSPFDPGRQATDYSLQLAVGIANFDALRDALRSTTPQERAELLRQQSPAAPPSSEGGAVK